VIKRRLGVINGFLSKNRGRQGVIYDPAGGGGRRDLENSGPGRCFLRPEESKRGSHENKSTDLDRTKKKKKEEGENRGAEKQGKHSLRAFMKQEATKFIISSKQV